MKTWKGRQQKITREESFAKERELSIPMKSFAGSMRETARKTINVKHHYHWLDDGNKTSFEVDNDIFCGCCCRRRRLRLRLRRHVNLLMACNRRQEFWFTKWETQILLSTSFLRIRETLEDKWHWRSQVLTDKRGIQDFVSVSDVKYETLLLEFSTQVPNPLSFFTKREKQTLFVSFNDKRVTSSHKQRRTPRKEKRRIPLQKSQEWEEQRGFRSKSFYCCNFFFWHHPPRIRLLKKRLMASKEKSRRLKVGWKDVKTQREENHWIWVSPPSTSFTFLLGITLYQHKSLKGSWIRQNERCSERNRE